MGASGDAVMDLNYHRGIQVRKGRAAEIDDAIVIEDGSGYFLMIIR